MVNDFSLFTSCGENVIFLALLENRTGETSWMVAFINSGRLLHVRCVVLYRGVYQKVTKACVTSVSNNGRHGGGVFAGRGGLNWRNFLKSGVEGNNKWRASTNKAIPEVLSFLAVTILQSELLNSCMENFKI